jgi:hypothetical protein
LQRAPDAADLEELPLSDYESGSPPSRGERTGVGDDSNSSPLLPPLKKHSLVWNLPDLRPAININFTGNKIGGCSASYQYRDYNTGTFGFASRFWNLYDEHMKFLLESDMDEDRNCTLTSLKQSQPNKSIAHLHDIVSMPTKQAPEDPWSENCQCYDPVDICGMTQQWRFQGAESHFDAECCNRSALGSKCCDKFARQAPDSVVSGYSACSSDNFSRKQRDADVSEIVCSVDSVNSTVGHSSSLDAGSPMSRAAEVERRLPHALGHSSPTTEMNGIPNRGSCGERGQFVGNTAQHTPPIWCLDCHENLIAVGCANGRLEFWEGSTGTFKVMHQHFDSLCLFLL